MSDQPTILVIGTLDTKAPELLHLKQTIEDKSGRALIMDVGVVGDPPFAPHVTKEEVAGAAEQTIEELIAMEDENESMLAMALGASRIARQLSAEGRIDGMIALGGTMGTDLAFDVALAMPIGVPKVVISSVAIFAFDPARAAGSGPDDDPLGGRFVGHQFDQPRGSRTGGRRRIGSLPPFRRGSSQTAGHRGQRAGTSQPEIHAPP